MSDHRAQGTDLNPTDLAQRHPDKVPTRLTSAILAPQQSPEPGAPQLYIPPNIPERSLPETTYTFLGSPWFEINPNRDEAEST